MNPNSENQNDPYISADLGEVTSIVTKKIPVSKIEIQPKRCVFHFADKQSAKQISELYWSRQLNVDALEYFSNLKILKSQIHRGMNRG
jgi:hypothetical protein